MSISSPCRIIAEAGVNHNGNLNLALQLVDAAAAAGADIVKFQTFCSQCVISTFAPKAAYQQVTTGADESQLDMVRKLELPPEAFARLAAHAAAKGIGFLSTPFDLPSVDVLATLGLGLWKIPSGEITNLPYLRKIGAFGQAIILSTGMSTVQEVGAALEVLERAGTPRQLVTLLHCTTEYPAPYAEVNLRAMQTLSTAFPQCALGYSDHTQGLEVSLAAVALGATVIEKHFTLDRSMEGPDHRASLEPGELAALVHGIRHVEMALGESLKAPTPSEIPNMLVARKSIVAARPIKAGERLTAKNLTTKRPGSGISPMLWDSILDTPAPRDLAEDEAL